MSDEGFDPCECMHYFTTQHLLSIIRQSQNYCTDTECFSVSRTPGPQEPIRESSDFFFICMIIAMVVLMYAFRPRLNFRQSSGHIIKNNNEPDSQNDPPSPPTAN